jgi:hypothetical protein
MRRQLELVDAMSDDARDRWASDMMAEVTDEIAKALDIAGWKIVFQDDPTCLWPFSSKETGSTCPDWCEDLDCQVRPSMH